LCRTSMKRSNALVRRDTIGSFASGPNAKAVTSNFVRSWRSNKPAVRYDTGCARKSAEKYPICILSDLSRENVAESEVVDAGVECTWLGDFFGLRRSRNFDSMDNDIRADVQYLNRSTPRRARQTLCSPATSLSEDSSK